MWLRTGLCLCYTALRLQFKYHECSERPSSTTCRQPSALKRKGAPSSHMERYETSMLLLFFQAGKDTKGVFLCPISKPDIALPRVSHRGTRINYATKYLTLFLML